MSARVHIEGNAAPAIMQSILTLLADAPAGVTIVARVEPSNRSNWSDLHLIIERAAFETGVSLRVLTGPSRGKAAVRARYAAIWVAAGALGLQSKTIAAALGARDPSTVRYGVLAAQRWRAIDPAFRALTDKLAMFAREAGQ